MQSLIHRTWIIALFVLLLLLQTGIIAALDVVPASTRAPAGAGSDLVTCSARGGFGLFYSWQEQPAVVSQCRLTAPAAGYLFITADATAGYVDEDTEAMYDINVDSETASGTYYRYIGLHSATSAGTANTAAISTIRPVVAGEHTVSVLLTISAGPSAGWVEDMNSTLSVIFIPAVDTDIVTCAHYSGSPDAFETTSSTYEDVVTCSLNAPVDGWAYVTADAHADTDSGYYEAMARINLDGESSPSKSIERRFDVGDQDCDATVSMATTLPLVAGSHTFFFQARRTDGATGATVELNKPTLSAIFVPWDSLSLRADYNTLLATSSTTINSSEFQTILLRNFSAAYSEYAYISANATVWSSGVDCLGHFRIGMDDGNGDANYERSVDLGPDSADVDYAHRGTHKALAITAMVPATAGQINWVYFVGATPTEGCTITVINPTLTVLTPTSPTLDEGVYLPLVIR